MEREEFLKQLKVTKNVSLKPKKKYNPEKRNIVIGGAWPYANSSLHLGHLVALLPGDFLARYHRKLGDNVIYVSGTDCHDTPITQRAKKEGRTAKEIAEEYHNEFVKTFKNIGFTYDLYGKTEDECHKRTVQKMLERMYKNGYIYEKADRQPFCDHCNRFLADRELTLTCPSCGKQCKGDQCDCGYIPTEEDLDGATCVECGEKVHLRDNKNCTIYIWDKEKTEWVGKEDTGVESFADKEKGLASDSFKRAAVNWGIGRSLYSAPAIFLYGNAEQLKVNKYSVKEIEYDTTDKISKLIIQDKKGNVVYTYPTNAKNVPVQGQVSNVQVKAKTISLAQQKRLFAIGNGNNDVIKNVISRYGYTKTEQIKASDYDKICTEIESEILM